MLLVCMLVPFQQMNCWTDLIHTWYSKILPTIGCCLVNMNIQAKKSWLAHKKL
jgi:hypothetical protein